MNRAIRVAVLAITSALALAFAGSALAAYQPRLNVFHEFPRLNDGGRMALIFSTERTDEATAKLTIYAPAGYRPNFAQTPGTQLGTAEATIQARAVSPDVFLPVQGTIQADSPANWGPQSQQCTGTTSHANVWVLVLTASGRELRVPIFVDPAVGGEAGFASLKLQVCLPPPDVPESAGGAAFGAKVVEATLLFNAGVFTTPAARNLYVWHTYATPYTNFRPPVNAAGTFQARALVALPITITLRARYDTRRSQVVLTGTITAAGLDLSGETLALYSGRTAGRLTRAGSTSRVTQRGAFSARRRVARTRVRRTMFFRVEVSLVGTADQAGCAVATGAPAAPAGCTAMITVFGSSVVRRVAVPRRR